MFGFFKKKKDEEQLQDIAKTSLTNNKISAKIHTTFAGIDYEFIDLLFFEGISEKNEFLQSLILMLDKLEINEDSIRTDVNEKIHQYIDENEISFPFLIYLFNYKSKSIMLRMPDGLVLEERMLENEHFGIEKLNNYSTALNVATHNLDKKRSANYSDIIFEEDLINKNLRPDNMDYTRIDSLFSLGHSFCLIGDFQKMGIYFQMIENDKYDLSPNTVADFIRLIGEDYNEIGDFKNAYHYLTLGLKLNPNIRVKKLLAKIEKLVK